MQFLEKLPQNPAKFRGMTTNNAISNLTLNSAVTCSPATFRGITGNDSKSRNITYLSLKFSKIPTGSSVTNSDSKFYPHAALLVANMMRSSSKFNKVAPHISLHTEENANFFWTDDYTEVTNEKLKVLLLQCRHASIELEIELERRRFRKASNKRDEIDECLERLHKLADQIKIRERLNDRVVKHAKTAVEILKTKQTTRSLKIYQEFLHNVLRQCDSELVLLCAVSLEKHKIANLKTKDRVRLLNCINKNKLTLNVSELSVLVRNYRIFILNSELNKTLLRRRS